LAWSSEGAASTLESAWGSEPWAPLWVSGSGDWRPAFGADIFRGVVGQQREFLVGGLVFGLLEGMELAFRDVVFSVGARGRVVG